MKKNQVEEQDAAGAGSETLRFTKKHILKKYADRADILSVILSNSAEYTDAEVKALLNNFMKGKVKD